MAYLDKFRQDVDTMGLAAEKAGLEFQDIDFLFCKPEILSYVAAYSLPTRFAHWGFGKRFTRLMLQHRHGLAQIHELVCFAEPCQAFLSENNSRVENLLVAAHVMAHSDFFANNVCFNDIRTDAPELMAKNRAFVRDCMEKYSVDMVEEILDAALALGFYADLLKYLAQNSQVLASWQQWILEMVLEESRYFKPVLRTRILNEGWAAYWHTRLMGDMELTEGEALEFALVNADALETSPFAINPYRLGCDLFLRLQIRKGDPGIFAIRREESDVTFFDKYLQEDMVCSLGLAAYEDGQGRDRRLNATPAEIRELFLRTLDNCGKPKIIIDNADAFHGELYLKHLFDGRQLNLFSARKTLEHVYLLWGKPVFLLTEIQGRERWLAFNGSSHRVC